MDLTKKILSDITVHMKYAKYVPDLKRRETWDELVTRNMNMHIKKFPYLKDEIEENYKLVFERKVLSSMRSLQFGGKPIEISPSRLYNCAFLPIDNIACFSEVMFLLLGGSGVGYSVQKHHIEKLPEIIKPRSDRKRRFLISDSIEGWADTIKVLMKSYTGIIKTNIEFDYSDIRQKGARLVTSGGKAPGPQPLKDCVYNIKKILDSKVDGDKLTTIEVHDIICFIADAVLAGGIRRAALISLFSADDEEMISCKSGDWWEKNQQRGRSNNSAVLVRHKLTRDFFDSLWERIKFSGSGEPGIYLTNDRDMGTNPCCFTAETLVATADGRNAVSIGQLCDENYQGPVYSLQTQTGQVITSYCSRVWKSRENAELVRVTLDDNSTFVCTPDHRIMLRNGQYVEAKNLKNDVSLMPFNSYKRPDRNYRMIQSNTGRDLAQYSHVAQYFDIIKEGYEPQHLHHKDGNGLNDLPENLEVMLSKEHNREHMIGRKNAFFKMGLETLNTWKEKQSIRQRGGDNTNSNGLTSEEMYELCYNRTLQKNKSLTYSEVMDTCGVKYLSKGRLSDMGVSSVLELIKQIDTHINHKVLSVEFLTERQDVYDMTVEGTHNFAIITSKKDDNFITSSGVFVHNCEISLKPYSFCNLCEVNVSDIESQEDYNQRVKVAAFIGTLQASYTDFHYLREIWKKTTEKDALIGVGMTGIGSGVVLNYDMAEAANIVKNENKRVAKIIGINSAARSTTVKPSGSSSLVLGTSSGIHAWFDNYYIRRIRVGKNESIYTHLSLFHPEVLEDDFFRPHDTAIISIPQKAPENCIIRTESPMNLLDRIKSINKSWIKPGHTKGENTNNISATISIKDDEWEMVGDWMWENRDSYNGLSVLPYDGGSYVQAPFETITEDKFNEMIEHIIDIDLSLVYENDDNTNLSGELACSGNNCEVK